MLTMCVYRYRREKKKNICWFCVLTLWAWECICRNEYMLIMWVSVCWLTGPTSLIEVNGLAATYDLWWYVIENEKYTLKHIWVWCSLHFYYLLQSSIHSFDDQLGQIEVRIFPNIITISIASSISPWRSPSITADWMTIGHWPSTHPPGLTEVRESPKTPALFLGQKYKKSLLTIRNMDEDQFL